MGEGDLAETSLERGADRDDDTPLQGEDDEMVLAVRVDLTDRNQEGHDRQGEKGCNKPGTHLMAGNHKHVMPRFLSNRASNLYAKNCSSQDRLAI
jgi:hypothetical protein